MSFKKKISLVLGSILASAGALGAYLAAAGTCIVCLVPFVSLLGGVGVTLGILLKYNRYLITGGVLLILTGFFFLKKNSCPIKMKHGRKSTRK